MLPSPEAGTAPRAEAPVHRSARSQVHEHFENRLLTHNCNAAIINLRRNTLEISPPLPDLKNTNLVTFLRHKVEDVAWCHNIFFGHIFP